MKDLQKAKKFFREIGFQFNEKSTGDSQESACLEVGSKPDVVMLFVGSSFKKFTRNPLADTHQGTEVLLSIDASSRQEVDDMAVKVEKAGGTIFASPEEIDGWMYGCGFADVDGHRWNVLNMRMDTAPNH